MNPLSRVKPNAVANLGTFDAMTQRPNLAALVAQYIANWTEIETLLGLLLANILHANERAAVAMFYDLENRTAQLKMIESAANSVLSAQHAETISLMLTALVRPQMRTRDKFAHWAWGYSPDLPKALLITEPKNKLSGHINALRSLARGLKGDIPDVPFVFSQIFVVREGDLKRALKSLSETHEAVRLSIGSCWTLNDQKQRDECLSKLSNWPQLRKAKNRQTASKNSPAAPPQSRQPTGPKKAQKLKSNSRS